VDRARPQPGGQGEAGGSVVDEQRQVLLSAVMAVITPERLPAVDRVVAGVEVEDEFRRRLTARAEEQLHQVVVEDLEAAGLGGPDFEEDGPFLRWRLGLTAGVGVLQAGQGRTAGQGVVRSRRDVGDDLKERVVAERLGIVKVGTARQDLIDLPGEESFDRVLDVLGGAGSGESLGQIGDDPQGFFQGADGEQAGIADDATAVESDLNLLRADSPQGKVLIAFAGHDHEPPHGSKLLVKHSLDSA
jgi:hypothetical protein